MVGKSPSRILVKFELVLPMAPALRKTKRASEVAKRCWCLHPTSQFLTSLGRGKWTTSNQGPSLIRYTLFICLQFSKDFYPCPCFYVHAFQNNYTHTYRPVKIPHPHWYIYHPHSNIPIFVDVTNLRRRHDGDGNKNTEFNKRNFQIVLKMI